MENKNTKFDLEDRLVDFACMCLEVCDYCPIRKPVKILNTSYQKAELPQPLFMAKHRRLNQEQIFYTK